MVFASWSWGVFILYIYFLELGIAGRLGRSECIQSLLCRMNMTSSRKFSKGHSSGNQRTSCAPIQFGTLQPGWALKFGSMAQKTIVVRVAGYIIRERHPKLLAGLENDWNVHMFQWFLHPVSAKYLDLSCWCASNCCKYRQFRNLQLPEIIRPIISQKSSKGTEGTLRTFYFFTSLGRRFLRKFQVSFRVWVC